MDHLFVNDIDWDGLLRQKAEFVPNLEGDDDTSYFDLRADRFPQHDDYEEDSDDDIMINSFSSCSPRYTKVYQKIQEMKNQQEHDSLSRQSSDNSSVFGGATHISSDSGSESPRLVTANEKVHNEDFSFDKANMASTPEFLKSSLKSNTSTPKRPTEKRDSIGKQGEKEDDSSLPSNITEGLISKRAASRSVSFDSDISGGRDRTSLTEITTPTSPLATPNSPLSPNQRKESSLAMPTSPLATPTSPVSPNHRVLRRSDALGPTAADVIHRKDNSGDTLDEADGGLLSTPLSTATTPDSVFPSAPSTPPTVVPTTQSETAPLQYDVLPDVSSYTPVPVLPVSTTASLPPMITSSMDPLTVVTSSQLIRSSNKAHHPLSLSLGATSTTESLITPILPITFTEPTSLTSSNTGETMPPTEALKHRLQITSSSDSASSSANNSPGSLTANQKHGSSGSISLRRNRSSVGNRLQRSKHPGNMLLAKVNQRMNRPRSHTSPDCNLAEDVGERHKSLPEVSVSRSTPSPPSHKGELSLAPGPVSADIVPARRSTPSPRLSLSMRGATNSCPVPVPQSGQSGSKSMFVKSASATQLSLLIPPPQTDDFGSSPHPNVLLSPTSSASSRDQSPTRDALRRPPYILKKGRRGYGFFLKAIRVYSSDGNFYHLNHLITSVTEGSMAHQAGLRPNYLVTHINNEAVHGLPQPQIVRLIQKNSNMVTLRALPIEETSLKPGVKSQSELRKAKMITRRAVKKKQSFNKVDRRRQRSSSLLKVAVMRTKNAKQAEC